MGYVVKTLGTVAQYINGRAFKPSEWEESGRPIIRIQNLTDNKAMFHYSSKEHENKYLVQKGDLLFAWAASLGAHIWKGQEAWLNQHIFRVIPNDDVRQDYLYYYLIYVIADLYAKTHGSGMVHITKGPFMNTPIPVPPLEEQTLIVARIEELFSELDAGVDTLQKIKQQLSVYRRSVLKDAFMPKDNWRKVEAGEIGQVCLGRQRSPQNVSANYPTKYIRAANITEKGIDTSDILEMEFTPTEREKYYLKYNDIVVSEASGSKTQVGKPALWKNEIDKCCFQNTVIRHRITSDNPSFVYWQYKYHYLNGGFAKMVGGVGINHIGAKNFSQIELWLAPLDQQKEIVERIEEQLSLCEAIEATIETALQEAYAMRQSILKQAFEGEL